MSKNKDKEILFLRIGNGGPNWIENGDADNDGKYIGKIENGKPNGTGSITFPDGREYLGEFKDGKEWNGTQYDKDANENSKYVNGKVEKNDEPLTLINAQSKGHFS